MDIMENFCILLTIIQESELYAMQTKFESSEIPQEQKNKILVCIRNEISTRKDKNKF